jgi:heat-inducible transcriptional repressor
MLEVGNLSENDRIDIAARCQASGRSIEQLLTQATETLSGLSSCAGLVTAPKSESPLKHVEFVLLGPGRALVVLVSENGLVENRIIDVPLGLPPASLIEAGNYLSARLNGRTVQEARAEIVAELEAKKAELDELTAKVVETGLATWAGGQAGNSSDAALIVRGQANLLHDVKAVEDLERVRTLFEELETKKDLVRLLELTQTGEGVRIFIGAENDLFGLSGCSVVAAPYNDSHNNVLGIIGVVGPTRLNYARIIPMVDYTAQVIGRLIG